MNHVAGVPVTSRTSLLFAALACLPAAEGGERPLRLANVFGSAMVLQRDMPVPVWGWAAPGAEVSVGFRDQRKTTTADADGRWRVVLDPLPAAAAPGVLEVASGAEAVSAGDVLVGDVWLCAGPGIMRTMDAIPDAANRMARATFPQVRLLRPDTYRSIVPVADIPPPAVWTAVDPRSIRTFSVTWHVGRELHLAAGVPVGVVLANVATDLPPEWSAWKREPTDKRQADALRALAEQLPGDIARTEAWLSSMKNRRSGDPIDLLLFPSSIPYAFYNRHPVFGDSYPTSYRHSCVYNALIGPLVPLAIRGVVLNCEFESQHGDAPADSIKDLVESWRTAWGRPGLPFLVAEPLEGRERAGNERKGRDAVTAAVAEAAALRNVVSVPAPAAFSDRESEDYWKSVALAALKLPMEAAAPPPPDVWPPPAPVQVEPPPAMRRLEAAHLFADDMVLQCEQPLKVWGWAEPGAVVTVSFAGQAKVATTDAAGRWQVMLDALPASDRPATMTVKGTTDTLAFDNVVVGEVWINSGQSNSGYVMTATLGFAEEQPEASYPMIRYFANARAADVLPQRRNMGRWVPVSAETVGQFSGMGYYFARAIHRARHVPVGIVEANHGGSSILSWMSDAALASSPKFAAVAADRAAVRDEMIARLPVVEEAVQLWAEEARRNADLARPFLAFPVDASPIRPFYGAFLQNPMHRRGSMFYNAMIHPMIGFGVRGVLWNQGEADGARADIYDDLMAAMIADWRTSWGTTLPFYYVQMPARKSTGESSEPVRMWDAQTRALAKIPDSGMIVCNDISEAGTPHELHPRDKKSVGERLARLALARTYGVQGTIDASPMMASVVREGPRVVVTFTTPGEGLQTRDGRPSDSWEIADSSRRYVPATAEIAGARVIVSAAGVTTPVAVRLGWRSDSDCNLVNSAGLPALPFSATVQEAGAK